VGAVIGERVPAPELILRKNAAMPTADVTDTLSAGESEVVERILSEAWGGVVRLRAASGVRRHAHVIRLHTTDGRSAVLKRRRTEGEQQGADDGFGAELAALEFLGAMPEPVVPRLVGADAPAGMAIMEDLPDGHALAESLLSDDAEMARSDLIAYGTAIAAVHAWSIGRTDELDRIRARYVPDQGPGSWWLDAIDRARGRFMDVVAGLGLSRRGVEGEIDQLNPLLDGGDYLGFVHGDLCPDNVRLVAGSGCRIFDFETSSRGSVALDAGYLLAPFPSCWCFSRLPADIATAALDAYRDRLRAGGIVLGHDWEVSIAAALGAWVVARGDMMAQALDSDGMWGTVSMRARLLAWTESFVIAAERADAFGALRALVDGVHQRLRVAWAEVVVPDYPALGRPGAVVSRAPDWWQPGG
jgi:hypothetical protein